MSTVSDVFDRIRSRSTTINQFNQGIIALENIMTPGEAREIAAAMAQRENDEKNIWLDREADWRQQFTEWSISKGFSHNHRFVRVWNRPSSTLYQTSGFNRRAPKLLVVLFTGRVKRIMVPSWIFLAHLPRVPMYVLTVRGGQARYRDGLPGLTKDFPGTIGWIRDRAEELGLTVDTVIGSSAGSLPALRAGFALRARRRLLFGLGRISDDEVAHYPVSDVDHESGLVADDGRGLTLVAGGEETRDVESASEALLRFPRAERVIVDGAGHNCVEPLAQRGGLHRLMRKSLGLRFRLGS